MNAIILYQKRKSKSKYISINLIKAYWASTKWKKFEDWTETKIDKNPC